MNIKFMNLYNSYSNNKDSSNKNRNNLNFGCRFSAIILPNSAGDKFLQQAEDSFIRSCLLYGKNSLIAQAPSGRTFGDGFIKPHVIEDISGALTRIGNKDGFGFLGFQDGLNKFWQKFADSAVFQKNNANPKDYKINPDFKTNIGNLLKIFNTKEPSLQEKPNIVFAHIRATMDGSNHIDNTHPFYDKESGFGFMHNGSVNFKDADDYLKRKLQGIQKKSNVDLSNKIDTEKAFYIFLDNIKTYKEKLRLFYSQNELSLLDKKLVFADTMKELIDHTKQVAVKKDLGWIIGMPAHNFVATDGENIFAFQKGAKLYVGKSDLAEGNPAYIVASEMMQPKGIKQKIEWWELNEQYNLLTISKNENNILIPEIMPLSLIISQRHIDKEVKVITY